jgi:hypothetical protein
MCRVKNELRDCLDYRICNYFELHAQFVKFKAIFKINTINFVIIHVVIDFNENHCKQNWMNLKKIMDS